MAADYSTLLLSPLDDGELYNALVDEDRPKVNELCRRFAEGPFHVITKRRDCVLQLALYSMQVDLVLDLLSDELLAKHRQKLSSYRNESGNTILHEAATQDKCIKAAKKIVELEPQLLTMYNVREELAIFNAARYGQLEMFKFLKGQIEQLFPEEFRPKYHTTDLDVDNKTILHIAINHGHFEMALYIAKNYPDLVCEKNRFGMTGLQILAMNPLAFANRHKGWAKYLKRSPPKGVLPWLDEIRKEGERYEAAVKLAYHLVQEDTAWIHEEEEEDKKLKASSQNEIDAKKPPTALMLATKWGCMEIVREILRQHPQTVEYTDPEYGTILHIAIQYRRIEVLDIVEKMKMPLRRLVRKDDRIDNSILHMVGEKIIKKKKTEEENPTGNGILPWEVQEIDSETHNPAFQLQDDLLLFDRVEEILTTYYHKDVNLRQQTAEQLFSLNKEELRAKAQEWLKRTAENCTIVAVLIATVAFAAAYTVPGGSNQNTGSPILIGQTFFVVFTASDVTSLTFALTSVVMFLSILTSSFRLQDFKESLPQKLMTGLSFLIFSVTMMMLAFAATIILMIKNKEQWTKIALYAVAFLPVTILMISYLPLYVPLMRTFKYTCGKMNLFFPRLGFMFKNICLFSDLLSYKFRNRSSFSPSYTGRSPETNKTASSREEAAATTSSDRNQV